MGLFAINITSMYQYFTLPATYRQSRIRCHLICFSTSVSPYLRNGVKLFPRRDLKWRKEVFPSRRTPTLQRDTFVRSNKQSWVNLGLQSDNFMSQHFASQTFSCCVDLLMSMKLQIIKGAFRFSAVISLGTHKSVMSIDNKSIKSAEISGDLKIKYYVLGKYDE